MILYAGSTDTWSSAEIAWSGDDRLAAAACYDIVAIATISTWSAVMFETLAFLSTVGLIVIFVVLFQIDRAGRREEEEARK